MIPFGILPGHWGLKGKTREIAKAEYELSGYDLEVRLCQLNHEDQNEYKLHKAAIDHKYNKISDYEYALAAAIVNATNDHDREKAIAEVDLSYGKIGQKQYDCFMLDYVPEEERPSKELEMKLKYGDITKDEYDKSIATIKGEPWSSIKIVPDKDDPRSGTFNVDYNDAFIDQLASFGFVAPNIDDVLDMYITDFCKGMSMSSVKATMDFMEEIKKQYVNAHKVTDDEDE